MESKGRLLPVGAWRHIQNFTLSPSTGMYRATDHPFKMSIIQNKTITRSPLINEDMFLSLVAFAITINKSQGQSLSEVGLFLPRPVFSHRQLYVAISRVTSKKGLKILIVDAEAKPQRQTMNVVFKEIFANLSFSFCICFSIMLYYFQFDTAFYLLLSKTICFKQVFYNKDIVGI